MKHGWTHLLSGWALPLSGGVAIPSICAAQTISGRVLEEGSTRAVADAAVSLADRRGKTTVQVLADSAGRFVIAPREADEYRLLPSASATGPPLLRCWP
ncbi:MAG: hypothetical protein AMXMBFR53_15220 [Gemmatimonadota bacterium]